MSDETMWYYMDSTGQEFGPYPSSTMKGWFQQRFFPMQGELQVRTDEMSPGQHYSIRELYGEPILQTAFDGEPKLPGQKLRSGSNRNNRSAGGGSRGVQSMPNPMDAPSYDGGMGAAAALGMPWMMAGGGMPSAGLPFGFPAARPGFPGFPGFPAAMMPGPGAATGRFQGTIKSFNVQKGFGFIECPEAHQVYGRDVFLHKAQIGTYQIGSQVSFAVEMNKTNMPQARDLVESDIGALGYGGAMPGLGFPGVPMGGVGGKGGPGNQKGGGKGKGGAGKTNKGKGGKGGDNKKAGDNKKSGGGGSKQQQPQQLPPQQPQELPPQQ